MLFTCNYCNKFFCAEHHLPENHKCIYIPKTPPPYIKTRLNVMTIKESQQESLNTHMIKEKQKEPELKKGGSINKTKPIIVFLITAILIGTLSYCVNWYNTQPSLESLILLKINFERTSRGLAPLHEDSRLDVAARLHCEDMIRNGYFEHEGSDGTPSSRAEAQGYPTQKIIGSLIYTGVGENIIKNPCYFLINFIPIPTIDYFDHDILASNLVNSWMNSPGHRANILDPIYMDIGIGVAWSGLTIYSTTNFGLGI
jgi:uncharacterized protein YkwD